MPYSALLIKKLAELGSDSGSVEVSQNNDFLRLAVFSS